MAIGIDNVYQQVLAIANKEQRGYITPQEFNLFARKAQNDIFEKTFIEYKDAFINPTSVLQSHKNLDMLREKMDNFRVTGAAISVNGDGVGSLVELGNEILTNSDLEASGSWAVANTGGAGWTVPTGGAADCSGSQTGESILTGTVTAMAPNTSSTNKQYRVSFTVTDYVAGSMKVKFMGNTVGSISGPGEYSFDGRSGTVDSPDLSLIHISEPTRPY